MAKKKAKPKYAPRKPTAAWAVVHNKTGVIATWGAERSLCSFDTPAGAVNHALRRERVVKVRITEA